MMPTATAVVADIADAARSIVNGCASLPAYGRPASEIESSRVLPMKDLSHEHYVRLSLADKPGVLAKIAEILGRQGIGIATVAQHERAKRGAVPVVIRTHKAKESGLEKALGMIRKLDSCRAKPAVIRVEESLGEAG
jgi:homoserine dehydrogenase